MPVRAIPSLVGLAPGLNQVNARRPPGPVAAHHRGREGGFANASKINGFIYFVNSVGDNLCTICANKDYLINSDWTGCVLPTKVYTEEPTLSIDIPTNIQDASFFIMKRRCKDCETQLKTVAAVLVQARSTISSGTIGVGVANPGQNIGVGLGAAGTTGSVVSNADLIMRQWFFVNL